MLSCGELKMLPMDAYGILGKHNFTDWLISDEILNWLVWFEHPNFSSMSFLKFLVNLSYSKTPASLSTSKNVIKLF